MSDLKRIDVESIVSQVTVAAECAAHDANRSIRRATEEAIEAVKDAAQSLQQLPKSSADLLERASVVLSQEIKTEKGWNGRKPELNQVDVRVDGQCFIVQAARSTELESNRRYRVLVVFLPLPLEEGK